MALQLDHARSALGLSTGTTRFTVNLKLFMNRYSIEPGGKNGITYFLRILHNRRIKIDIVDLPLKRRKAHIHL